jgi:hypothetical protein
MKSLLKELQSLQNQISSLLKQFGQPEAKPQATPIAEPAPTPVVADKSILDLKLSIRARNSLYKAGIDNLSELMTLTRDHLMKIDGLSHISSDEIVSYLYEHHGFSMPMVSPKKMKRRFIYDKSKFLERQDLNHKSEVYKRACVVSDYIAEKSKWDWSKSQADLAKEHGCTRERVRQIRNKLVAAGLLSAEQFKSTRANTSFKY